MVKEINWKAVLVMVQTILGEARTGNKSEMKAVASVIINRVNYPSKENLWWGTTIEGVCKKPCQFECWNSENPIREKIESLNVTEEKLARAIKIAIKAITRTLIDPTNGATHFYTVGRITPYWARNPYCTEKIGGYKFCHIGP